jgi:hypothetical protein
MQSSRDDSSGSQGTRGAAAPSPVAAGIYSRPSGVRRDARVQDVARPTVHHSGESSSPAEPLHQLLVLQRLASRSRRVESGARPHTRTFTTIVAESAQSHCTSHSLVPRWCDGLGCPAAGTGVRVVRQPPPGAGVRGAPETMHGLAATLSSPLCVGPTATPCISLGLGKPKKRASSPNPTGRPAALSGRTAPAPGQSSPFGDRGLVLEVRSALAQ